MNVLITGATGMVGKGVLLECIDSNEIKNILLLTRKPVETHHPKFKELLCADFTDLSSVKEKLDGLDACFHCMGVSAAGLNEESYSILTYDITLNLAKTLLEQNPGISFSYVSGAGTDSTEKGRFMWARVKGKTENDLLSLGFKRAHMYRPGFIQPRQGVKSSVAWYNAVYTILKPLVPIIKYIAPNSVTSSDIIGKAMINVALNGFEIPILEMKDINKYGQ